MQIIRRTITLLNVFLFCNFISPQNLSSLSYVAEKIRAAAPTAPSKSIKRDWTFLVYMAANNDLSRFSVKNIMQMMQVGSNDSINIIVQLDKFGEPNIERIYIQKNKAVLIESNPQTVDNISGTPESLYNFISWGVKNFPSNKLALSFWNHGSGIKDMNFWGRFLVTHRDDIYRLNPTTGLYELNYQILKNFTLMKQIEKKFSPKTTQYTGKSDDGRGIAMNDTFHVYLTNQDLQSALDKANNEVLGGKKIDIIFMDACFMATPEIASQIKKSGKLFVASEEAVPGTGYNYEYLLAPFLNGTMTVEEFAINGIAAFEKEYKTGYSEYTQSAMYLEKTNVIEQSVSNLTTILLELIRLNKQPVIAALKSLRNNKTLVTEFYDSDYIDLISFCKGLENVVTYLKRPKRGFTPEADYIKCLNIVKTLSEGTIASVRNSLLKTTKCEALPGAYGLSIYFPKHKVHESYYNTVFDQTTHWSEFLNTYIKASLEIKNIQLVKLEKKSLDKPKSTDKQKNKNKKKGKDNKKSNKPKTQTH